MMKRAICLLILSLLFLRGYSQRTFTYAFFLHGQQVPVEFTVSHATDTLSLGWKIRGLATGTYIILPSAVQHGVKMNFVQPNTLVQLGNDETFCMISVDAFNKLAKDHQFMYDNTIFDFKGNEEIAGVKVLHVAARDETTELWIMDNSSFPLVCRIKGSPLGIDCLLLAEK